LNTLGYRLNNTLVKRQSHKTAMNQIEQNILNYAETGIQVAGSLVAAQNPAYAGIIALIEALSNHANSVINPGAAAAAPAIANAAATIAADIPAGTAAVAALVTPTSPAAAKGSALGSIIGTITSIGGSLFSIFEHATPASPAPAPVIAAAAAASNPSVIVH
jgi:hypothetical protein